MTPIKALRSRALKSLIPPARLRLSEWIESDDGLRLPADVSNLPGRMRLWSYQREIADAMSDPEVPRVTLVKPVRVGFTSLLSAAVGSYVANEPSPILVLLPTEADCRQYAVSVLDPIFEATPSIRGLLSSEADDSGRNTLNSRRFPGGSLKIVAAKSPRNLRAHNVKVLIIDEADAMESTAEGDPITLAERRTLSFTNRKIILGSTPIDEDTSHVLRAYSKSDKRIFEVPCRECGVFNEIQWAHIEWEPSKPETAAYRCPHCNGLIGAKHKTEMVEAGRWRATDPDVKGHAGFRMNALISTLPNASWAILAAEWLAAQGRPDQLKTFANTILAQGWAESADKIDDASLAARAERFDLNTIPMEVLTITVGVDIQDDRLEITFLGHSRDETFVLAHEVIWGLSIDDTTWAELDELLKSKFKHPGGGMLGVDATILDSGDGGITDRCYAFTRPRFGRRIMSGKGVYGASRPAVQRSSTKGIPLFLVGVDGLKAQILNRLQHGRSIRFSDTLEVRYYEELTSEPRVVVYRRGRPERSFKRIGARRAECLDCMVYGLAAKGLLSLNLDRREAELTEIVPVEAKPNRSVVRSRWLGR